MDERAETIHIGTIDGCSTAVALSMGRPRTSAWSKASHVILPRPVKAISGCSDSDEVKADKVVEPHRYLTPILQWQRAPLTPTGLSGLMVALGEFGSVGLQSRRKAFSNHGDGLINFSESCETNAMCC